MDVLFRIKRLVLRGWIRFTEKARDEAEREVFYVFVSAKIATLGE